MAGFARYGGCNTFAGQLRVLGCLFPHDDCEPFAGLRDDCEPSVGVVVKDDAAFVAAGAARDDCEPSAGV